MAELLRSAGLGEVECAATDILEAPDTKLEARGREIWATYEGVAANGLREVCMRVTDTLPARRITQYRQAEDGSLPIRDGHIIGVNPDETHPDRSYLTVRFPHLQTGALVPEAVKLDQIGYGEGNEDSYYVVGEPDSAVTPTPLPAFGRMSGPSAQSVAVVGELL